MLNIQFQRNHLSSIPQIKCSSGPRLFLNCDSVSRNWKKSSKFNNWNFEAITTTTILPLISYILCLPWPSTAWTQTSGRSNLASTSRFFKRAPRKSIKTTESSSKPIQKWKVRGQPVQISPKMGTKHGDSNSIFLMQRRKCFLLRETR